MSGKAVTANPLLSRSRLLLGQALRLHLASVEIGRYERIADTGVIDAEAKAANVPGQRLTRGDVG